MNNYINEKISEYANNVLNILPSVILSIIIFIIFYIIAEYYKEQFIIINKQKSFIVKQEIILDNNSKIEEEQKLDLINYQLGWMLYYSIIIFGSITALVNLGFNIATIVTLLGSIGLTLGLALQDTIKNIISGIYISINKLFSIGDLISLKLLGNSNGIYGKIIEFNLYYTTIYNQQTNTISLIPNSTIQTNILTNLTLSEQKYMTF